ncbi:hypothetical protein [Novosphingobium olei]|uniref:Uncharacterized protein n=1 Tax=Novosphingobium olei TaxID=2728851 RepID=A0A7Y0BNM7_9SPHN|nr:hypothetical protein [Novosphingobium olei]NML93046.1 hypothetical protein [Novosphingobium olei]
MKLYLVEIGGMRNGNLFESHEVHPMVAFDDAELIRVCAARFSTAMKAAHLDGWIEFELEDPDAQNTDPTAAFYVAELGRNSSDSMREQHDYRFLEAKSWKDAVQTVRQGAPGWHVDACVNVDELARERGYALKRGASGEAPRPRAQSRYVRFMEARVSA